MADSLEEKIYEQRVAHIYKQVARIRGLQKELINGTYPIDHFVTEREVLDDLLKIAQNLTYFAKAEYLHQPEDLVKRHIFTPDQVIIPKIIRELENTYDKSIRISKDYRSALKQNAQIFPERKDAIKESRKNIKRFAKAQLKESHTAEEIRSVNYRGTSTRLPYRMNLQQSPQRPYRYAIEVHGTEQGALHYLTAVLDKTLDKTEGLIDVMTSALPYLQRPRLVLIQGGLHIDDEPDRPIRMTVMEHLQRYMTAFYHRLFP
ncbi:hypothetical protein H6504_00335 [Candidatus Woesearchaeota archaeon]|nr:hypothetical protein [Candidatus Woesearchaeota archaeon]